MSLPWSEKELKVLPDGDDQVMILDSDPTVTDPDDINKRALLSSLPSSGQTNTGSNIGSGEGVFAQKNGVLLEFKSLLGETDKIDLSSDSTDITFTLGSLVVTTDQTNTYSAGAKQFFVTSTTTAGININTLVPSSKVVGDIWRTAELIQWRGVSGFDRTAVITETAQTLTEKTLTAPTIATILNGGTLTLPTSTDTLVGLATTDTLTNKTLTAPVISTIFNTGTLTLPTGPETLVGLNTFDTLANKTLTAPVISTIFNTGTLTLPTGPETLVGRATSDTFTNKIFDANATGNSLSNVDVADLADGQDGELITWNTSGIADVVAVGSIGEVLTSQGSGNPPIFVAPTIGTVHIVNLESNLVIENMATLNFVDTTDQIDFLVSAGTGEAIISANVSSSYVGQSSITTLGTITTGTWNGDTITVPFGGTGNTTLTENGVLFGNAAGAIGATDVGLLTQVLTSNGSGFAPTFQDISTAGIFPVSDDTVIIEGDTNDTKLLKFEVDGNDPSTLGTIATIFTSNKTITIPDAVDTLVGLATPDTLTNKTLTAPQITSASSINDTNGNELIQFPSVVGSAANEITISNVTTGNSPIFAASGTDSDIGIEFRVKGTENILFTNDNTEELLQLTQVSGDALNFVEITNALTGVGPTITSSGETDIDLNIDADGVGSINLLTDVQASGDVVVSHRLQRSKGADVASGSTITLTDGNYFDITGITDIDFITTSGWQTGSEVSFQFDDSLTVESGIGGAPGGTLNITLTGGNLITSTGDTLTLILDDTTWREIGRST